MPWAAARVESAESTPNVAANPAIMPGSTSQEREGRREGGIKKWSAARCARRGTRAICHVIAAVCAIAVGANNRRWKWQVEGHATNYPCPRGLVLGTTIACYPAADWALLAKSEFFVHAL